MTKHIKSNRKITGKPGQVASVAKTRTKNVPPKSTAGDQVAAPFPCKSRGCRTQTVQPKSTAATATPWSKITSDQVTPQ